MSVVFVLDSFDGYSYQHLQGIMLVNLNKIAFELNLSNSAYRIMGLLIGLWNKKQCKAFPTIDYLAFSCKMSKSTIIKTLKILREQGLIEINTTSGRRHVYYLTDKLLKINNQFKRVPSNSTACKTSMVKKQKKNITDKIIVDKKDSEQTITHNDAVVEKLILMNTNNHRLSAWQYILSNAEKITKIDKKKLE